MAQKNYRVKTNIGGHAPSAIITKEDVSNTFGASVDDWLKIGAIEETDDGPTPFTDVQQSMTDAALKDRIENAIRTETGNKGRPLTVTEQHEVSGRLQAEHHARLAKRAEEGGAAPDEDTYAGRPLSAYAGKSDDEVLKMEHVGPATLADIRKAEKKSAKGK